MLHASTYSQLLAHIVLADGSLHPQSRLNALKWFCFCGLQRSKYKSLKVRAGSTVVIIASFIIVIYLGHVPLMAMILAIQVPSTALDLVHLV